MSVTIQEIAAKLALSPSTVSRSLRQSRRVHPQTRADVAAMAAELGYQGRARRGKRAESGRVSIGLLLRSEQSHSSPNALRYLQGMTAEADATDVRLSVHAAHPADLPDAAEHLPAVVRSHECDVLVLEGRHDPQVVALIATKVPVVSLNWLYEGVDHDAVLSDNHWGIQQMVDHLVDHGHRHLAWIGEWYAASFDSERQASFIQRSMHHGIGLSDLQLIPRDTYEGREPNAAALHDAVKRGVTAFVCANDRVAQLVVLKLEQLGMRVPDDVSVTGFDAMFDEDSGGRKITTIDPQFVEMGRVAISLAVRRAAKPGTGRLKVAVAGRAIVGQTTGAAPTRG